MQSVDRAVSILQVLARLGSAGVTEIAGEVGIHKSTVSRLLSTLEARGLVDQTAHRGSYRLGVGVVRLAEGVARGDDLLVASAPVCARLADEVGETVTISVREGESVVTLDQVVGASMVTAGTWVGWRSLLHVSAAGKVFLAAMSDAELHAYARGGLSGVTEHTITSVRQLQTDLAAARRRGYTIAAQEQEQGLTAMAAPIHDHAGAVVAAVAVSAPTFRMDAAAIEATAPRLLDAAAEVSERNGYPKVG